MKQYRCIGFIVGAIIGLIITLTIVGVFNISDGGLTFVVAFICGFVFPFAGLLIGVGIDKESA